MKTSYTVDNVGKVELHDGTIYSGKNVIVCTGGFYMDINLAGLLSPSYSYLSSIPCVNQKDSPNYFTYGFSHDWCISDNYFRVSGEDHHSAYLHPKHKERCENLRQFIFENYPTFINHDPKA